MVLCWSDYWLFRNEILREMQNRLTVKWIQKIESKNTYFIYIIDLFICFVNTFFLRST